MSGTAFDALREALFSVGMEEEASADAEHIVRLLSRAGYVIVPAGSVWECGPSAVCVGQHVLILDGLTADEAADASHIMQISDMRNAKSEAI